MKEDRLIKVFTGTELTVNLLKETLEEAGIGCLVRNDFQSGVTAGFSGGIQSAIFLFVQEKDKKKADPIIAEFIKIQEANE